MKSKLQDFYSQDSSLKKMNPNDQMQRFEQWAKENELNLELTFKRKIESAPFRLGLIAFATLILILEILGKGNNLYIFGFVLFFLFVYRHSPKLKKVEPVVIANT